MITTLVLLALLQDDSRREWEGFREGSSVSLRYSQTDGEKQESDVRKYTVGKVEPESVLIRIESGRSSKETPFSLKKDTAFVKRGAENVDIDGRTFACTVWEKIKEEGRNKVTLKEWIHKDIPGRLARIELTTKSPQGELKGTGRVTRLDQRIVVGGKTITYCIYEFSGTRDDGRVMSAERWVSEMVPGFTVREVQKMRLEGSPREVSTITELVDFEVK